MKLEKLSRKTKLRGELKKLYKEAFPPDERVPFGMLMRRADSPLADLFGLFDDDTLVGFAYVVKKGKLYYLFYFAMKPEERGKGYGSETLALLREKYRDGVLFLALEKRDPASPNYEERLRRHAFYERCGFTDVAKSLKESSVVYDVMTSGGDVSDAGFRPMMREYLGPVYRRIIDTKITEQN